MSLEVNMLFAVMDNDIESVNECINNGIEIDELLHLRQAISHGYLDMVKIFVHHGSDILSDGEDYVWSAAISKNYKMLEYLLSMGCSTKKLDDMDLKWDPEKNVVEVDREKIMNRTKIMVEDSMKKLF